VHLTRCFCSTVLLYGLECISDNSILRSVQFCWSRILLRVFKIASVDNTCHYARILPPTFVVDLCNLCMSITLNCIEYIWTIEMQTLLGFVMRQPMVVLFATLHSAVSRLSGSNVWSQLTPAFSAGPIIVPHLGICYVVPPNRRS